MKNFIAVLVLSFTALSAGAASYNVDAFANSVSSGNGLATLTLSQGEAFSVDVAVTDLWSSGPLPRWSNADGQIGDLFATGTDESGEPAGTLIGEANTFDRAGLTLAIGTLVGELNGSFFAIGTHYTGVASQSGILNLFYWDNNNYDNFGSVAATVTAVPEPASFALLGAGLLLIGSRLRRRARA